MLNNAVVYLIYLIIIISLIFICFICFIILSVLFILFILIVIKYFFLGLVHDSTDSYVGALYFTSFLSLSCVFLWLIGGLWTGRNTLKLNQRNLSEEQESSLENI